MATGFLDGFYARAQVPKARPARGPKRDRATNKRQKAARKRNR